MWYGHSKYKRNTGNGSFVSSHKTTSKECPYSLPVLIFNELIKVQKRNSDYLWIPLWIDKWIFGSTRIELSLEERSIWIDFIVLAGKDNGYIRANENTPYLLDQLAGILLIPRNILEKAIEKFKTTGKIEEKNGIYKILSWDTYKLSPRHKRRFMSTKKDTMSKKADTKSNQIKLNKKDIYTPEVINYLNEKAKTSYKTTTKKTNDLIKARLKEGFTLEDFKTVIKKKCRTWLNDSEMCKYLRPETLFGTKFEGYLNEPTEKRFDDDWD